MDLSLILCGRYCDTAAACAKTIGSGGQYIIFCEDRLTLSMEKAIARKTGGSFNVKVTTFSRYLASKTKARPLSKEGSVMAVAGILLESRQKLSYLKGGALNLTAQTVYELIAQLKSSRVTPGDLLNYNGADGVLNNKLADLELIYRNYQKFLEQGLEDENSYLALIPDLLANDREIAKSHVVFAGFSSFTRQGAAVIEAAVKYAEKVTGIFCGGESELYTNEAVAAFERVCAEAGKTASRSLYPLPAGGDQSVILQGLFDPLIFKTAKKRVTENIFIYEAQSAEDEYGYIAQRILFEVAERGYRFKDVAIAASGEDNLALEGALNRHGIPFYSDKQMPLSAHPLAKFLLSHLKMCAAPTVQNCLDFIKNPYFESDRQLLGEFENFVLRFANYTGFLSRPFRHCPEKTEELRARAAKLILPEKRQSVQYFCRAALELITMFDCENATLRIVELLPEGSGHLKALSENICGKTAAVIDETQRVMGNAELSIGEFYKILESGISAKKISLIPVYNDAVAITGYDFAGTSASVLFASSLTQAVPAAKPDTAFISDRDIALLDGFRIKIEPRIRTVNDRARECAGVFCASYSDRLYLSYAMRDSGGKPRKKSEIINYIRRLFCYENGEIFTLNAAFLDNLSENEHNLHHIYKYAQESTGISNFMADIEAYACGRKASITAASSFYRAASGETREILDNYLGARGRRVIEKVDCGRQLFVKNGALSVSVLEEFYTCPYRNFLSRGIGLKERQTSDFSPAENGIILHGIMDAALSAVPPVPDDGLDEFCAAQLGELLKNPPYLAVISDAEARVRLERLAPEAARILRAMKSHGQLSKFKTYKAETSFGFENSPYPALDLGGGTGIKLHGIVDRIDTFENLIRVIDYKSGRVNRQDLTRNYYSGKKIQLWLYLNAVKGGSMPAGAYYFDLNDDFTSPSEGGENYKMTGITCADKQVIQATDDMLNQGARAQTVNVQPAKTGFKGDVLYPEDFANYLNYSRAAAARGAECLSGGVISASPEGGCGYCPFKGLCLFDDTAGGREISELSAKDIADAVISDNGDKADRNG